jgi:hydrogenase maturation protein HypF
VSVALTGLTLPRPAPRGVLAFGAFLKNSACLLRGRDVLLSPVHGDLGTPDACLALAASVEALVKAADGGIEAVVHDLHPDFESTRQALAWAERLGVPAFGLQHHHAHVAVVQAEQGQTGVAVGLALDGVGLGTDGTAWGGELLCVHGAEMLRLAHLSPLALPGGDVAAREPWRMAAAALHRLGRGAEITTRFAPQVGEKSAGMLCTLLERGLHCPVTTSAGRWFDAVAGLLHISVRQTFEAEAAIALEQQAAAYLAAHPAPVPLSTGMDVLSLVRQVLAHYDAQGESARAEAAAMFHVGLSAGLVEAAADAATAQGIRSVVLSGGCFFNRVLTSLVTRGLEARGLTALLPHSVSCGDAGLALGQAWAASLGLDAQLGHKQAASAQVQGGVPCV